VSTLSTHHAQVEVEAPFLKQQHPLEVVQDEAFPNAVGIAAADPARVDPDQDYFAVREQRIKTGVWSV